MLGAIISLSLCLYCFMDTAGFVWNAKPLPAKIVAVEKTTIEKENGTRGFRPVYEIEMPSGGIEMRRFSGLYRVDPDAINEQATVLYNPTHRVAMAPDSSWNWIGSFVYGAVTVGFLVASLLVFIATRRFGNRVVPG